MRDLIYEFTFHGYIRVYNAYAAHPPEEHAKFQVLHICRQIRHEATPVLYRTCIFDLRALYEADIHAYHVGQHLTDMITSIRIPAGAAGELIDPSYSALTSGIYALPALKEVRIQGQVYVSLKPDWRKQSCKLVGKRYNSFLRPIETRSETLL
jgi:hypothetical protein